MKYTFALTVGAALIALSGSAFADTIASVEGARARDRAGYHLNRQDREQLRRYGDNDDWGYRHHRRHRGYDYYDGYYGAPGLSIYIGPRSFYGPYDY